MIYEQGEPEASRRVGFVRGLMAGALAGAVTVGSFTLRLPLLIVAPGPARNAAEVVKIEGAPTFSSEGSFLITTVTIADASLVDALRGWASAEVSVVPRSAIYPPGTTREELDRETATQMDDSQLNAAVAALRALGYELPRDGALIRATVRGLPAARELRAGDVIVAIDGRAVATPEDASAMISARRPGETLRMTVRRDGETRDFEVRVAQSKALNKPVIGVQIIQSHRLPFEITIEAGEIGGPSAGLTFALTIVDLLSPEDLTHGRTIADTGTIDSSGNVGPIGGISQKVAAARKLGARVFLVPSKQLAEARAAAPPDMIVIGVSTLREALDALRRIS